MSTSSRTATFGGHNLPLFEDQVLLPHVVAAVQATGRQLLERFKTVPPRFTNRDDVFAALQASDEVAMAVLVPALTQARPGVNWAGEGDSGALPAGEWWVTDAVEGNINQIHGMTDWAVTATLVRDNVPVLTAVHVPLLGTTYTAVQGGGAYQDGTPLRPSAKARLEGALVGTGQALPGEDEATRRLIGRSSTAMLEHALLLRVSVPATLQLVEVAAGRMDVFWQHSQVRSGLLSGALLVAEAGGRVTDIRGAPWTLESDDFLASAPTLHAQAVTVLSALR